MFGNGSDLSAVIHLVMLPMNRAVNAIKDASSARCWQPGVPY